MSYVAYLTADRKRRRNLERIKMAYRTVFVVALVERNREAGYGAKVRRDLLIAEVERIFEAECKAAK